MTVGKQSRRERKARHKAQSLWPDRFAGAYLGWGHSGPVHTGPEHAALVIGPPRSGKTSAVIIPALALWPGPAVITSTKPDVLNVTHRHRARHGTVWHWDPTGTLPAPPGTTPLRWSPIPGCADWDTAVQRAWALATTARPNPSGEAAHWVERAQALLAPLLHAADLLDADLAVLASWVHTREALHPLSLLTGPRSAIANQLLQGILATDPREQSGIWSTADSLLAAYRTHTTLQATHRPNFHPAQFATSRDTLYITAPSDRQAQHAPLICALLDQLRHHTVTRPTAWPPHLWALDEVANIAPLPTLPAIVADSGASGLLVLAALQDLSQARQRWGPAADGFLTLFPNTLALPGIADPTTLKTITTLAGQTNQPYTSVTNGWNHHTRTATTRKEPLLPEHRIAQGHPGYALHLRAATPTWLALTPWHTTPPLTQYLIGEHR